MTDRSATQLCRLSELTDGQSRGVSARDDALYADVVLIRRGRQVYAYRNCCPHTRAPMEDQPDEFLSLDGQYIQCAIHGARFRIEDGYCISGPCSGRRLTRFEIAIDGDSIWALEPLEPDR